MMLPWTLNTAWMLGCAPEARAFAHATRQVAITQSRLLNDIVRANEHTSFGRDHAFSRIHDPAGFRQRVPPSRYEDYADRIARIAAGEQHVLTREPVELLEPTSGTVGGEKLIPFTHGLRRQFQRAVAAWMANLLWRRPALRKGRAYWSISPYAGPPRRTAGGLPIGFSDDAAYLSSTEQWALRRLLVVPGSVAQLADADIFRYVTLYRLLAAGDLALISIWSPTFLPALLSSLNAWHEPLCHDIATGRLSVGALLPGPLNAQLRLPPMPRRAARLRQVFRAAPTLAETTRAIWPGLTLISAWTDAGAASHLPALQQLFPGVEIQGKGLLATEGCVSFPLVGRPASVLALRSHFLEFEPLDACSSPRLAHELDLGGRYRVILTTAGGLYRYQLRDEVEVVAFEQQCPLVRFLGKGDGVSDMVGEKLSEPHVRAVLTELFERRRIQPRFAMLVPAGGSPPRYRLYVQGDVPEALGGDLERLLHGNPHYAHAVRIGQLAPVEVAAIAPTRPDAWEAYERGCVARGMRRGNIKPMAMDPRPGWPTVLDTLTSAPAPPASATATGPAAARTP